MNADALFQQGREPWMPVREAANLRVLHVYEVPTVGTFDVEGVTVLFRCLSGHLDRLTLWAYTDLTPMEAKKLVGYTFPDAEQFEEWLDERFSYRDVRFTTAIDDEITHWSDPRKVEADPLREAQNFLEGLLEAMSEREGRKPTPNVRATERPKQINQVVIDAELRELEAFA